MDLTRTPVLECQDLCFSYAGTSIFKNISLKVDPGIFCAILGRNGSGKTTLIHCLNQTLVSESGQVKIQVKNIHDMRPGQIARQVSLVPQEQLDIFPFKVLDVVVMGRAPFLGLAQRPGPKDYDLAAQALDHLNAGHLADKAFNRISGGEKQITLLARALIQASDLLLLDEPCNHLDFNNQFHLLSKIKTLCRSRGISILASMHDQNLVALFADQVVMIRQGTILAQGRTARVMTSENISALYNIPVSALALNKTKDLFFPDALIKGSL